MPSDPSIPTIVLRAYREAAFVAKESNLSGHPAVRGAILAAAAKAASRLSGIAITPDEVERMVADLVGPSSHHPVQQ
jgi:hypothetical protein